MPYTCWDCEKPLPPGGAGKCAECAGAKDKLKTAPHCLTCKTALVYWPGSKMAKFNPKCKCVAQKEAA